MLVIFFVEGDVDRAFPGGFGLGLHLRKAIYYSFSLRFDAFYGRAFGLDPQPWSSALLPEQEVFNGYGLENPWFPSYRVTYGYGAVEGILNIGNLLFHKERNKWNLYLGLGAGLDSHKTELNLRDGNNLYSDLIVSSGYTDHKFNTRQGRLDIKDNLRSIYDDTYETEGFKKRGIFRFGDETNVHINLLASVGVSRKVTRRFNIALEHQVMYSDNDYLDGIKYRTATDQTNNVDVGHYTNLRLAFNLGNFSKKTEPLYWLNPLDNSLNDIAELKRRPVLDLTDADDDGVLDMFDEELDTPEGSPVDSKGRALDSDGDGILDIYDEEPYSPPGFDVNEKGVAQIPDDLKVTRDGRQ